MGDGCPGAYGVFTARDVFVDAHGNIFFTSLPAGANYATGYASVRVIYVAGTQVANLIQGYNPSITSVSPGYVYALSASEDFIGSTSNSGSPQNTPSGIASIVADSSGNLYVSDNGANATATGPGAVTSGNQIKKRHGLLQQRTNYHRHQPNCRLRLHGGGRHPVFERLDRDQSRQSTGLADRQRPGEHQQAAGGAVRTLQPVMLGVDAQGDLLVGGKMTYTSPVVNTILYRIAATTGTVTVLGGLDASNVYGVISTAPAAGVSCGGGTTGPAMTDALGDGCPAIEVDSLVPYGRLVFDTSGSFYSVESRNTSGTAQYSGGVVRKYTFPGRLGSSTVGSALAVNAGFEVGGSTTTPPVYSTPGPCTSIRTLSLPSLRTMPPPSLFASQSVYLSVAALYWLRRS